MEGVHNEKSLWVPAGSMLRQLLSCKYGSFLVEKEVLELMTKQEEINFPRMEPRALENNS